MSTPRLSSPRGGVLLAVALALLLVTAGFATGRLAAQPTVKPTVWATVIPLSCTGINDVGGAFAKIADVGTFDVRAAGSLVELQFNGRLYASATNGSGVRFEVRVDDTPTSMGRIRAVLKQQETGDGVGVGRNATMSGFYEGLAEGTHMISIWAQTANGTDSDTVAFDPGCWGSDVVNVKEYMPFGAVALPAVLNN